MPKTDDPIVYRFTGSPGESLTGIPGRSLRQSDVDAMDADQKKLLKAHLDADHLPAHIYKAVEDAPAEGNAAHAAAPGDAAPAEAPAKSSKAAKAGSEK